MTSLEAIALSVRTCDRLRGADIHTVEALIDRSPAELLTIKNISTVGLNLIKAALAEVGLSLRGDDGIQVAKASPLFRPHFGAFVYFIRCQEFVKIGVADSLAHRLRSLQTASPFTLELLAHIRCDGPGAALAKESHLHREFAEFRVRGEWFRLEGELRDYVRGLS